MAPEVFYTVCYPPDLSRDLLNKLHTFTPALLHDHCRHRIISAEYPGVIKEEGASVLGVYATGLTDANMEKLDHFEGDEYERVKVKVKLLTFVKDGDRREQLEGDEKSTNVYLFRFPDQLERGEWDFEHFRKEKMSRWTRADYVFEGNSRTPKTMISLRAIIY
jgi:hypothetical protein